MDHKTKKALITKGKLHTEAVVSAHVNPSTLTTTITAYPPEASITLSNEMMQVYGGEDKHVAAQIAKMIGNHVAKVVEEQVLKSYMMSAQEATQLIHETHYDELKNASPFSPHWEDANQGPFWNPIFVDPALDKDNHVISGDSLNEWVSALKEAQQKALGKDLDAKIASMLIPNVYDAEIKKQLGYPPTLPGVFIDETWEPTTSMNTGYDVTQALAEAIPGFLEMTQACPIPYGSECPHASYHGAETTLKGTIIHLNDHHKWTREEIADWLDTLDHDLTFKIPEEVK